VGACDGPIDIPAGSEVVVAVDAGIRRDSTAVVTVRKDDDGIFHAGFEIWMPSRDREVRLEDVEEHIVALCERFDVRMVAYDKHCSSAVRSGSRRRARQWSSTRRTTRRWCPPLSCFTR
jgi:hypothetical protein